MIRFYLRYDDSQQATEFKGTLEDAQRILVRRSLIRNGGHVRNTTKELGIATNTLYRFAERFDIDIARIRRGTKGE